MDLTLLVNFVEFLLDKATTWQVAVFCIVLVLKKPFTELIGRVISFKFGVGASGVSLESELAQAQAQMLAENDPQKNTVTLSPEKTECLTTYSNTDTNLIFQKRIALFSEEIKSKNLDTESTLRLLTESLAAYNLLYYAELIYRLIFGSQIILLKRMNANGPLTEMQLRLHYAVAKHHFQIIYNEYSCEQYTDFLITHGLISHAENQYVITEEGKAFLQWIAATGLSENKPF